MAEIRLPQKIPSFIQRAQLLNCFIAALFKIDQTTEFPQTTQTNNPAQLTNLLFKI